MVEKGNVDPVAVERAERDLDKFINSRSKGRAEANAAANEVAATERLRLARRRKANRYGWIEHHRRMADLHADLAEQHRLKAEALEGGDAA